MTEGQVGAIEFLARQYDYGRGASHARKVADLSTSLFDQLADSGLLESAGSDARRTLYAAAIVHDIGSSLQARHDAGLPTTPTSVSSLENTGFVSYQLVKALLDNPTAPLVQSRVDARDRSALLHAVLWSDAGHQFETNDEPVVAATYTRTLAGILSLARGLDCRLSSQVSGLQVVKAEHWVRVLVRSMSSVEQEVSEANAHVKPLEQVLGTRVFVQEIIEE